MNAMVDLMLVYGADVNCDLFSVADSLCALYQKDKCAAVSVGIGLDLGSGSGAGLGFDPYLNSISAATRKVKEKDETASKLSGAESSVSGGNGKEQEQGIPEVRQGKKDKDAKVAENRGGEKTRTEQEKREEEAIKEAQTIISFCPSALLYATVLGKKVRYL